MAQATLNPAIEGLDNTSMLYDLYTRFYDGMTEANSTDTPEFISDPIYKKNEDGSDMLDGDNAKIVDTEAMTKKMAEYSSILMKNSAYMMANAIVSTLDPDGGTSAGSSGAGFLSRGGDTMQGELGALNGFQAGYNKIKIFETIVDSDDNKLAVVAGNLQVSESATIAGSLHLSDNGLYFANNQAIWYEEGEGGLETNKLYFEAPSINVAGKVVVDGSLQFDDLTISNKGISLGDYEFYHSGNSNLETVNWTMFNGTVAGNFKVSGESALTGVLKSDGGFVFSSSGHSLLYSEFDKDSEIDASKLPHIVLNSDLSIVNNHGIKLDDNYIVWVRSTDNIVSFSAPGCVMNLGDGGEDSNGDRIVTKHIAIQTDIKDYSGTNTLISKEGTGSFPNGFSASPANALGTAFQTYCTKEDDYGVVSKKYLRFGGVDGPAISSENGELNTMVPFSYISNDIKYNTVASFSLQAQTSESKIYNPTNKQDKASIAFATSASHFSLNAPIEAPGFAIKSSKYKTRLEEDALFFDDGIFIEGITGGMRLSKNSMFDGNLYSFDATQSSVSFSSGFAGSGWAIMEDTTNGGIHATFDNLTIRKKMRIYEFEAQRISVTNGSFWVSDSCSGDEVRELD